MYPRHQPSSIDWRATRRANEAATVADPKDVLIWMQEGEEDAVSSVKRGLQESPIVLDSLERGVSPPRKRQRIAQADLTNLGQTTQSSLDTSEPSNLVPPALSQPQEEGPLRSPFQLTAIRDLPAEDNVDTLAVKDVFGSPNLIECWEFNYLHDLDFIMSAFDEGAVSRGLDVHVMHGFWKKEDRRRTKLEEQAARINQELSSDSQRDDDGESLPNQRTTITLHSAFMNEIFGTHHTKMAVLFRIDGHAQIVIHTANMIPKDWKNMTQAVWRSPLLPLAEGDDGAGDDNELRVGNTFKKDFLNYLRHYNQRRPVCRELIEKLVRYDFSAIQAVLVASVPGRHGVQKEQVGLDETGSTPTQWGWVGLQHALRNVPIQRPEINKAWGKVATGKFTHEAEIIVQVSSIATLGGRDTWLRNTMFPALQNGKVIPNAKQIEARERANATKTRMPVVRPTKPQFRVVFPVAHEIRQSLDGYQSGMSIHTKIWSDQQQSQKKYMNPMMCHWANDCPDGIPLPRAIQPPADSDSGRNRAAPHVKTYVRYATDGTVDWALLTSANLSKQAWGESRSASTGQVRIASYEMGVLVWPELLAAGAYMQPVFKRDTFGEAAGNAAGSAAADSPAAISALQSKAPIVPLRIPYSLPLKCYSVDEVPWVVSMAHKEPDCKGASWDEPVYDKTY